MKKLKQLRRNKGYTCDDMAKLLNISKAYYWQLENDQRRLFYSLAIKIANVFKLKPDDLFYEDFTKNQ